MALLLMDGFDTYGSGAQIALSEQWDPLSKVTSVSIVTGRFTDVTPAKAMRSYTDSGLRSADLGNKTELIVGSSLNVRATAGYLTFKDGTTPQITIHVSADGTIYARRGDYNGVVIGQTNAGLFPYQMWGYLEVRVVFSNTVGEVEVRLAGITVLNLTGVDTCNTSNEYATRVQLAPHSNVSSEAWWDDVYILDTTGTVNNNFLGPSRIVTRMADADSSTANAWTALGAGSKYAEVDESPIDSDTTYVYTATASAEQRFTHANISGLPLGTVHAVSQSIVARYDDVAATTFKLTANDGTQSDSGDKTANSAYSWKVRILETPPSGGSWDAAKVDACEFGVKHVG